MQPFSSSSRRKRGLRPHVATQLPPSCLVDGCTANLSGCRDYHRRHRVCEFHSKSPIVTINGRTMRFCQQCSRFQSLVEFDDEKRSCRKRLDGHNRRRRKRQSTVLPIISSPCLLEFGGPQPFSISNPTRSEDSREVSFGTTATSQDPKVVEFSIGGGRSLETQHFTFTRCFDETAHTLLSVASQRYHHQTNLDMGLSHVAHPQPQDLANSSLLFGYHSPVTMDIHDDGGGKCVQYIYPMDYKQN